MENFVYLFAAYSLIWIVLFGYVLSIFWRQRGLERELERLRDKSGQG
ncbi:MAG: CcmD family protein [Chloroflexi bacterium]|nr:CcmD family protein [Chloroflexota bacterium]